jgi:Uncharacterized membrane-associated protein
MQAWIIATMKAYGYLGVYLLITLENVFPPIPSEVILTFGGFMTTYAKLNVFGVILAATAGSVSGAIILYAIGRLLPRERLERILDGKIGKILHFKKEDVEKAMGWFEKRGKISVFICRCVPIVRSLISIPAGMAEMHFGAFLFFTTLGSLIWNIVLVELGVFAGDSWEKIAGYVDTYSTITLVVLVIVFFGFALWFYKYRIKKNNNSSK